MYRLLVNDNSIEEFEFPTDELSATEQQSMVRYLSMVRPRDAQASMTASNPLMLFSNINQYVYHSTELRVPNRVLEQRIFDIINNKHLNYIRTINSAVISKPIHTVSTFFKNAEHTKSMQLVIDEFKIKAGEHEELTTVLST